MDDVILLGTGTLHEWMAFEAILSTFCKAPRMSINLEKSGFLYNNNDEETLLSIARVLPYKMETIPTGFKYLGDFLKPLGNKINDWLWLIQKYEKGFIIGLINVYPLVVDWYLYKQCYLAYLSTGWH